MSHKNIEVEFAVYRGNDEEEEIILLVSGNVTPYTPAKLSGDPDSWCPEEGGEVEITSTLVWPSKKVWEGELTEKERQQAEHAIRESVAEEEGDDPRGEHEYDLMKEGYYDD